MVPHKTDANPPGRATLAQNSAGSNGLADKGSHAVGRKGLQGLPHVIVLTWQVSSLEGFWPDRLPVAENLPKKLDADPGTQGELTFLFRLYLVWNRRNL